MKLLKSVLLATVITVLLGSVPLHAADTTPEHHLDGVSMNFYYQDGWGIHMEFYDGKVGYEWIAGKNKGKGARDIAYQSRKIGNDLYIVNFHETDKHDFLTLIFNFEQNVMYSSVIARYGTASQKESFRGGLIEHLKR